MDGLPENCSKSIALASAAKTEGQCHSMLLTQPDTGYDRSFVGSLPTRNVAISIGFGRTNGAQWCERPVNNGHPGPPQKTSNSASSKCLIGCSLLSKRI